MNECINLEFENNLNVIRPDLIETSKRLKKEKFKKTAAYILYSSYVSGKTQTNNNGVKKIKYNYNNRIITDFLRESKSTRRNPNSIDTDTNVVAKANFINIDKYEDRNGYRFSYYPYYIFKSLYDFHFMNEMRFLKYNSNCLGGSKENDYYRWLSPFYEYNKTTKKYKYYVYSYFVNNLTLIQIYKCDFDGHVYFIYGKNSSQDGFDTIFIYELCKKTRYLILRNLYTIADINAILISNNSNSYKINSFETIDFKHECLSHGHVDTIYINIWYSFILCGHLILKIHPLGKNYLYTIVQLKLLEYILCCNKLQKKKHVSNINIHKPIYLPPEIYMIIYEYMYDLLNHNFYY